MISMARTLGAPDRVPAGRVARSTSIGPLPGARLPETWEVRCMMWLYRSTTITSSTTSVPKRDHPADVVAGQVDEHHVLGHLLRVLDQLALEAERPPRGWRPGGGTRRWAGR